MECTEENIARLISDQGPDFAELVIDGKRVLNEFLNRSIEQFEFQSAQLLLDCAQRSGVPVSLEYGETDALERAIGKSAEDCVFVLKVLLEKRTAAEEAARIIGKNLRKLYQRYPHLVERYFIDNNFSVEMGRFDVPSGIFDNTYDNPFVIATDDVPSWDVVNRRQARRFWKNSHGNLAKKIDEASNGRKVPAIWKLVCIEHSPDVMFQSSSLWGFGKGLPSPLSKIKDVDVFNSEIIRSLSQWWWCNVKGSETRRGLFLHLTSLACCAVTLAIWTSDTYYDSYVSKLFLELSFVLSMYINVLNVLYSRTAVMQCVIIIAFIFNGIFPYVWDMFGVLAATEAILGMIAITLFLKPFRRWGHLISMTQYVIKDISAFVCLLFIIVGAFALGFRVLYSYGFIQSENSEFGSLFTAFQTFLYALFGQFEPKVFHESLGGYEWICVLLFIVFLFIGHVILLVLLISIIGDTYDRVRPTQEAELMKCRAGISIYHNIWARRMSVYIGQWIVSRTSYYRVCIVAFFVGIFGVAFRMIVRQSLVHRVDDCSWLRTVYSVAFWLLFCFSIFFNDYFRALPLVHKKYFHVLLPSQPTCVKNKSVWEGSFRQIERMVNKRVEKSEASTQRRWEKLESDICEIKKTVATLMEKIDDAMGSVQYVECSSAPII